MLVRPSDTAWVLVTALVLIALMVWWRRGLIFSSFDPDGAKVRGLPVSFLAGFILVAIAFTVSIATRALGALPVFAFSVLPAMAAIALARNPTAAMLLAALFGALGGVGGYMLAFFGDFPVGASQSVFCALLAVLAIAARGLSPATKRA
ncbi:High-affinity zinc uptake system membrane protein ZnuB [compost metagenome]